MPNSKLLSRFKSFRLIVAASIALFFGEKVFSQVGGHEYVPDINSWQYQKYGDSPMDPYTGTLKLSIPIYTYKDKDFEIPVSIDYASGGYIPNMPSGALGVGWFLNAGGTITRDVRGVPDEYLENPDNDYYPTRKPYDKYPPDIRSGYYSYHNDPNATSPNYNISGLDLRGEYSVISLYEYSKTHYVETTPDIFHFKMPGHSGSFEMGHNSSIDVYNTGNPQGEYRVDMSGLRDEKSVIIVTTGDGYKYTFGGIDKISDTQAKSCHTFYNEKKPVDMSRKDPWPESFRIFDKQEMYNNWHLTKIQAPNGRKVLFEYTDTVHVQTVKPGGNKVLSLNPDLNDGYNDNYACFLYTLPERRLKTIEITNACRIDFDYNSDHAKEYGIDVEFDSYKLINTRRFKLHNIGPLLNNIKIWDITVGKKMIDKIQLSHSAQTTLGGSTPIKHFLTNVRFSNRSFYSLDYYKFWEVDWPIPKVRSEVSGEGEAKAMFPYNGTTSTDYWGYFNNTNFSYGLGSELLHISVLIPEYGKPDMNMSLRYPDETAALFGMLKGMRHSTGAYTFFEYESHDANLMVYRSFSENDGYPVLKEYRLGNESNKVGGVRIKRIIDADGVLPEFGFRPYRPDQNVKTTTRRFDYKLTNGKSSGIVLNLPVYKLKYRIIDKRTPRGNPFNPHYVTTEEERTVLSPLNQSVYSSDRTHIEYARVTETLEDNSSIEHNFTTYKDCPDIRNDQDKEYIKNIYYVSPSNYKIANYFKKPTSFSYERGRLKSKIQKNHLGEKVFGEYNIYDYKEQVVKKLIWMSTGGSIYHHTVATKKYPLSKTLQSHYSGKDSVSIVKNFEYNDHGQISKGTMLDSKGQTHITRYQYPSTLLTNPIYSIYNFCSKPSSIVHSMGNQQGKEEIYRGEKYAYGIDNGKVVLKSVSSTKLNTPKMSLLSSDYETDVTYTYDTDGNVAQTLTLDGHYCSYLWGYGGKYLVAKIDNIPIAQVRDRGFNSPIKQGLSPEQIVKLQLISNSMTTSYQYEGIGNLTSVCEPNGKTTYYEYDDLGRLKKTYYYDNNRKIEVNYHIINEFDYNYGH